MKRALVLLCGLLLVGCGNTEKAELPATNEGIIKDQDQTSVSNDQEAEKVQDQQDENEESASDESISKQQTSEANRKLDQNSLDGSIHIESENFIADMDEIFINLDDYEGKILTYEGLLAQNEEGQYSVVRTYELDHGDHSHSIYVGMDANYAGEWPAKDSWIKVSGTITRSNNGGEDYPTLSITEIEVLPEHGQVMVYN